MFSHLIILAGIIVVHGDDLPKNIVAFTSVNLENILNWKISEDPGYNYTVQYKKYGNKKWEEKPECYQIKEHSCNLTMETQDYNEDYCAQVIMVSDTVTQIMQTGRFNSKRETNFGPPDVTVIPTERSIKFSVQLPWIPYTEQTLDGIYEDITYYVKFSNHMQNVKINRTSEIENLSPETKYCGVVTYDSRSYSKTSLPKYFCITTLEDTSWISITVIAVSCSLVFLINISILMLSRYLKVKIKMPNSLTLKGKHVWLPPELHGPKQMNQVSIVNLDPSMPPFKSLLSGLPPQQSPKAFPKQPEPESPISYLSQAVETQPLLMNSGSTRSSGSNSYGEVVLEAANKENHWETGGGTTEISLPCYASQNNECNWRSIMVSPRQLVLQTEVKNGCLMLTSFPFEKEPSTSSVIPFTSNEQTQQGTTYFQRTQNQSTGSQKLQSYLPNSERKSADVERPNLEIISIPNPENQEMDSLSCPSLTEVIDGESLFEKWDLKISI
ncbi:interleukin-22 receptor subunit alpha-1-like [Polypterus senegalus]|uniref:interleukin-22 receptor subunit alpha-1-like n=1 Tax=Polypterus senegalus TaxID=55291 RepID=UPI00196649E1|nr:interleukin-22 receptor subunit alpha-1-like [Polypterus senegalus]